MEISTHFFNMHFTISIMLVCSKFRICHARDTITKDTPLYSNETIISAGNIFELGFFTGQVDDNRNGSFVGIWYYKLQPRTIVWVANRDQPQSLDSKQVVFIGEDNNLHFTDKFTRRNFTRSSNTTAKLLDTGNLVLIDGQSGKIWWQSFKHPTDTFLPGMKMTAELELTSWIELSRPGTGIYKFKLDEDEKLYVIKKKR
ncbi:transmembrane signal receptor [Lithospermum erythrorhizon]|uniref:Transmembrane signal receptor n=1 Tax=Lithospermum erythrorhizon TaxID=34254 RepID=A0AAV3QXV7_LITER